MDHEQYFIQMLVQEGMITPEQVERAHAHAHDRGVSVADALVSAGAVSSRDLALARASICEYPFVDLADYEIDIQHARILPRNIAERYAAYPLFVLDRSATIGMVDPLNLQAIDQIRELMNLEVDPVVCDPEQLRALIGKAYTLVRAGANGKNRESDSAASAKGLTTGDEPIVAAVNQILTAAIASGASDIHLNPDENDLHLRYRVDGVLRSQQGPTRATHDAIIQRLKVLADLDVTQTRRSQDGKFRFRYDGGYVDVRLSLLPTIHGENAVMRILRPASAIGRLDDLDMPSDMLQQFAEAIERPHGLILVTGPTGSGKTTTLYTALSKINSPERNIMTIEDPVELRLPLIRQVQANAEIGLTFASALRSMLRQDPDVVLVGEIRDQETAGIAVQAAMTGHLVLSTLHTNDAVAAVTRLRDLGVPTYAINGALLCAIAQRLVRRLCDRCATPQTPDEVVRRAACIGEHDPGPFRVAVGCPACSGVGYMGRVGVFEMVTSSLEVQEAITSGATETQIREIARRAGMRSMWEDGLRKVRRGVTSLEELAKLRTLTDGQIPGAVEGSSPEVRAAA